MIFVGYDDDTRGYPCIDEQSCKLTISRDVIFHENTSDKPFIIDDNNDSVREREHNNVVIDNPTAGAVTDLINGLNSPDDEQFGDALDDTSEATISNDPDYTPENN